MNLPNMERPGYARIWPWLAPTLAFAALGIYYVARYAGAWAESDSMSFTLVVRRIVQTGHIVTTEAESLVYPNGMAFQAISTALVLLTGIDVLVLQQALFPLLAWVIAIPAYLLYRDVLGSARLAGLATALLFCQPDFLFVIMRSSHEKFTRAFILLALALLLMCLRNRRKFARAISFMGLSQVLMFGAIAGNTPLGMGFLVSFGLAFALGWGMGRLLCNVRPADARYHRTLIAFLAVGFAQVPLFVYVLYPPSSHQLVILNDTSDRVTILLNRGSQPQPPAPVVRPPLAPEPPAWISQPVFFAVSSGTLLMVSLSGLAWLLQAWRFVWRRERPESDGAWLMWLLWAGYVAQGAASFFIDASGALSGNLLIRVLPSLSMVAMPLIAAEFGRVGWLWRNRMIRLSLSVVFVAVATLSIFKATNEPLVSNKWMFYRPEELGALRWANTNLQNTKVWTEFDERLYVAYLNALDEPTNGNLFSASTGHNTRAYLVTNVTRMRAARRQQRIPVPDDVLRIYDNGAAEIYRLRPQTPFQE